MPTYIIIENFQKQ